MKNTDLSASNLLRKFQDDKNNEIKIQSFRVFYNEFTTLHDISLNSKGQDEDKVYAFNKDYRKQIRRGNTIVEYIDKDNKTQIFWGRRGLEKFFDLCLEYVQYNLKEIDQLGNFGIKNINEHRQLKDIIFRDAEISFERNRKVKIVKLVKANGENAQITYLPEISSWLICSKNVSLCAQNKDDLKQYKQDRYSFARLIAEQWFRFLNKFDNQKGKLEELKNEMYERTYVGEYCGNQNYQHLVKYENIDIQFYAIVDHRFVQSCIPPDQAYQIFEKFGLMTVQKQDIGIYSDWNEFNKALKNTFNKTAEADIESEEEGAVLYFVELDPKKDKSRDSVLSLCKLKTLEYRIYRKLREKLRNYIGNKNKNRQDSFEKFVKETKELVKQNSTPKELEYYFKVANIAFDFADDYENQSYLIHEEYITFLSIVIYCLENNQQVKPELFQIEAKKKLLQVPWSSYKSSQMFSSLQSKNDQQVQNHQPKEKSKQQLIFTKNLIIFIPVSIPGMGKTTFRNYLQKIVKSQLQDDLGIISSDDIRKELIDEERKRYKNISEDQLFDKTLNYQKKQFEDQLKILLEQFPLKCQSKEVFLFIDKNHPPNGIDKTIDLITKFCPRDYDFKIVCIIPEMPSSHQKQKDLLLPFTFQFCMNCIDRVQNRTTHQTLNGTGEKSLGIMISFIGGFKNLELSDSVLNNYFHQIFRFSFHSESEQFQCKQEIQNIFNQIISEIIPNKFKQSEDIKSKIRKLSDLLKNYSFKFKQIDEKTINMKVQQIFQSALKIYRGETNDNTRSESNQNMPSLQAIESTLYKANSDWNQELPQQKNNNNNYQKKQQLSQNQKDSQRKQIGQIQKTEEIQEEKKSQTEQKKPDQQSSDQQSQQTQLQQDKQKEQKKQEEEEQKQQQIQKKNVQQIEKQQIQQPQQQYQKQQQEEVSSQNNQKQFKWPPIFLGIYTQEEEKTKDILKNYIITNASNVQDPALKETIQKFDSIYKYPQSHHVTTFYAGGKESNSEFYKNFKEQTEIEITIQALAIVPGKIICGFVKTDQSEIKIENKYPHLTMCLGEWEAKYSNNVLKAIFEKNKEICQYYNDGDLNLLNYKISRKAKVDIDDKGEFDVFFIKPKEFLTLKGITKAHYGAEPVQKQSWGQSYQEYNQTTKFKQQQSSQQSNDQNYQRKSDYQDNNNNTFRKRNNNNNRNNDNNNYRNNDYQDDYYENKNSNQGKGYQQRKQNQNYDEYNDDDYWDNYGNNQNQRKENRNQQDYDSGYQGKQNKNYNQGGSRDGNRYRYQNNNNQNNNYYKNQK